VYASSSSALATGSALSFDGSSLGIGTSSPSTKLHVASSGSEVARFETTGTDMYLRFVNSFNADGYIGYQNAALTFWTVNNLRATLNSTGLGIGTSSPSTKLNVVVAYSSGTIVPSIKIATVGGYDVGSGTAIDFGQDQGTYSTWVTGRIASPRTGNNWGGSLTFSTNNNTSEADLVERMRIDSSGNVGIGTNSPAAKIEVVAGTGNVATATFRTGDATATNNAGGGFYANSSATAGSRNARLWLDADGANFGGSDYFYIDKVGNSGDVFLIQQSNAAMTFQTNGTERARIDSSGNLLVGTTSLNPSGAGTDGRVVISSANGGQSALTCYNAGTGAVNIVSLENGNGQVGRIQISGTSTSYLTSSDYRLKENIKSMTGALSKISQLKPVTYKWKVDGSDGQGFIAHELAQIVPECVGGEKDAVDANGNPQYQGIDTSFLVATLTAAIQEQQAIIESLKARLDAANL
jgi:hypothetical protein